jgi:N-methylhydantoinase B/oxoprolinase/acetone carboxylase alpha subunit
MKNNFNAPEPVARAAVLYCFRVMVEGKPIPMNAGCLRPINIVIPEGCDAEAGLSARRRGRQCRDEPACDQRHASVRSARSPTARAR